MCDLSGQTVTTADISPGPVTLCRTADVVGGQWNAVRLRGEFVWLFLLHVDSGRFTERLT